MVEGRVLVHATVTAVGDDHFLYPCCSHCCSKMLTDMLNNRWHCLKCNLSCSTPDLEWRYRMRMTIADSIEYRQVSVFGRTLQPYFGTSANTFHRFATNLQLTHTEVADSALKQAVEMTFVGNKYFFGFPSAKEHIDNILVSSLSIAVHKKGDNSDLVAMQMISPDHCHVTTVSECISYLLKKNLTDSFQRTSLQEESFVDNPDFIDRRMSRNGHHGLTQETSEYNNSYIDSLVSILFSCENSLSNIATSISTSRQLTGSVMSADITVMSAGHFDRPDLPECTILREVHKVSHTECPPFEPKALGKLNHNHHEDKHADASANPDMRCNKEFEDDSVNASCHLLAGVDVTTSSPMEVLRQDLVSFDTIPVQLHCSLQAISQDRAGDETPRDVWHPSDGLQCQKSEQEVNTDFDDHCDLEVMPYPEDLDQFLLKTTNSKTMSNEENWKCGNRSQICKSVIATNTASPLKYQVDGEGHFVQGELEPVKAKVMHEHTKDDILPKHSNENGSCYKEYESMKVDTNLAPIAASEDCCMFDRSGSVTWDELPESEDLEVFLQRAEQLVAQTPVGHHDNPLNCRTLPGKTNENPANLPPTSCGSTPEQASLHQRSVIPVQIDSGRHGSLLEYIGYKTSRLQSSGRATIGTEEVTTSATDEKDIKHELLLEAVFDGSMELFDASADLFDDADDYQQIGEWAHDPAVVCESVDESVYLLAAQETPGSILHKKQVKFAKRLSHISSIQLIDIRMKLTFGMSVESPSSPSRSCLRRLMPADTDSVRRKSGECSRTGKENILPCPVRPRFPQNRKDSCVNPAPSHLNENIQTLSPFFLDGRPDLENRLLSQDLFSPIQDIDSAVSTSPNSSGGVDQVFQDSMVTESGSAPQQHPIDPSLKSSSFPSRGLLQTRAICDNNHRTTGAEWPDRTPDVTSSMTHTPPGHECLVSTCVSQMCGYNSPFQPGAPHSVLTSADPGVGGDCDGSLLLFSQMDCVGTGRAMTIGCAMSVSPTGPCCQDACSELSPDLFGTP